MFEKFSFSAKQIENYYKSALRDFGIASRSDIEEVAFRFCYDSLLKLAMAICAANGLRVKSQQGHHWELIQKLADYLQDKDIELLLNEMRGKRNWDLYGGGVLISEKEAKEYILFAKNIFKKADEYLHKKFSKQLRL
ncbi:MAG: hypothetical protein AAB723_02085 [Patescibacteria group bacterium]